MPITMTFNLSTPKRRILGLLLATTATFNAGAGQPASEHTASKNRALIGSLPFDDERDFEFATRGLIARPDVMQIRNEAGELIWDITRFTFLAKDRHLDTINPSLQRQAVLNMNYGLYQVTDGVYQLRGFDLANITYVRGETGWIVFDPLTVPETARAAHAFVSRHLGERPIRAVVYSHAHADHFGGVRGIVTQAEVDSGDVAIIAPRAFMEHVVKENLLAGNAMIRRASYQYGNVLPPSPTERVDGALGKGLPLGRVSLIAPTRVVEEDIETLVVDGVTMVMQNTPDTESPAEMNTWLPQFKTLWVAENVVAGLHNIYTLRGAQARDAQGWSKYINQLIHRFTDNVEVMMASHHWPRWGREEIVDTLEKQRDMYGFLHDQALHWANKGVTINEIHNQFVVPPELADEWYNKGYHGSYSHNVRGVINKYIGYYDGNPATLNKLSPAAAGSKYVALAGGPDKLLAEAGKAYARGEYRWVAELVNHLVFAEPGNRAARELQANAFEQLGYQAENAGWRNAYLVAASELRHGMPSVINAVQMGADLPAAVDTELMLDYLGVRLNAERARGHAITINLQLPDRGEQFVLALKHSHLNNLRNARADDADLSLTLDRAALDQLLLGADSLTDLLASGAATASGNPEVFNQLLAMLDNFDYWFEIVRP
ncbi:alkyl/aryl-sulfatase [Pseudomaricurvus alcaniphilus]|uniref:alkyl/aryl-sulfatase n=1 Tax=Pseudomaricurvus alcaniphilus TaxID=1166482 RepID=UPI001A9DD32D|nr:alkyl sulfatase dimerization domain-containing protein [Pseudomaricurvus alcaniphilus]